MTAKIILEKIVQSWPIIAALVGIAVTYVVQINMLQFRLETLEKEVSILRSTYSEQLESINNQVIEMKLDIRTLITLMKQKENI